MDRKQDQQHWANRDERGSTGGILFMLYTFKFLGATVCKIVMAPVLLYYYCFNSPARRNLLDYLNKLHQWDRKAPEPKQSNVLKIFFNFGFGIVDRMTAWQGKVGKFTMTKQNNQVFLDLIAAKQGAVILVSHLGNFEISKMASKTHGHAVFNIFMHTKNAEKFSAAIKKFNPDFELSIIQGDELNIQTAIALKEKVDQGEFVVIAGDRIPVVNDKAVVAAEFLGHQADFPIGPYVLAKVLACPLIGIFCYRLKSGYHVVFEQYAEQVKFNKLNRPQILQECAQKFAHSLETQLKTVPLQWYNFHKFWK